MDVHVAAIRQNLSRIIVTRRGQGYCIEADRRRPGRPAGARLGPRSLAGGFSPADSPDGVLGAMIATGYELARVNRLRQIDADSKRTSPR